MKNLKNCFLTLFLLCAVILISGCDDDKIIEKLANNQPLTTEETKSYIQSAENKANIDKKVEEKKQEMAYSLYRPVAREDLDRGKRIYRRQKGIMSEFDITPSTLDLFGFPAGSKITLPNGHNANVVGVYEGHLWFHVEEQKGATFSKCKNKEELIKEGYKLVNINEPKVSQKSVDKSAVEKAPASAKVGSAPIPSKVTVSEEDGQDGVYFESIPKIPYLKKN